MEIKTADQVLDEFKIVRYREYFKKPMLAYASQAVRLALEEAGTLVSSRTAKDHKGNHMGAWIDDADILSLADSIISKLK